MPETIFYAWQSDSPNNTNRTFIRNAIERAIEFINAELGVEDAIRADQDTEGVPGDVNIAEVIFEKIDHCRIFVADVTTITPPDAERPSPNPNVLIEYGRASVRPGSKCIVTIFNEAFGDWEVDRPFDLRHRRRPLLYNLPSNYSADQRRLARETLVSQLTKAFREILNVQHLPMSLPTAAEFNSLKALYAKTPVGSPTVGRIIGFWCGLIPLDQTIRLEAPWDHIELVDRAKSYKFKRGSGLQKFETIDELFSNGTVHFVPVKGGARYVCKHRYPLRAGTRWCDDVVAVYLHSDGRIALSVRTNNLEPGPHLNRRWLMADIANSLQIMDRVRIAAQKPTAPYAVLVEIRYDDQAGDVIEPVAAGEWRLCTLEDETGQIGTPVPSDPIVVGPLLIGMPATFPEILRTIYTEIVTSAGRKPEPDLVFEIAP
jgi:hypothetical protein